MGEISIPIVKDFYDLVETPGYLKHVIYGDSICEEHYIKCIIENDETPIIIKLSNLWDLLITKGYVPQKNLESEYIFNLKIKILNYNLKTDEFFYTTPKYFMRHYYSGLISKTTLPTGKEIYTTRNHSFVHIDKNDNFIEKKPFEIDHVLSIDATGENICRLEVLEKTEIDYSGYVYDFEIPDTHIFIIDNILVHNTDSLFIEIPARPDDTKEKIKLVNQTAKGINELIVDYTKKHLLPRCGFSPERNETSFKEGATRLLVKS